MLITQSDEARYRRFLDGCEEHLAQQFGALAQARARLDSASIVASEELPRDVATMHSQVRLDDLTSGRSLVTTVMLPPASILGASERSPLSWPAVALLGAREGEELELPIRLGSRRVRVVKVLSQPQAKRTERTSEGKQRPRRRVERALHHGARRAFRVPSRLGTYSP